MDLEKDLKRKRILILITGVIINMLLGISYSYGVVQSHFIAEFEYTTFQASLPFSFLMFFFTTGVLIAGNLSDRFGSRIFAIIGSLLFGFGYFFTSFSNSLIFKIISYGIIAGIGIGFLYSTTVATAVKCFPGKKGLVSGIVVFGFGFGSFVLSPLKELIIASSDWRNAFFIFGIAFIIIAFVCSLDIQPPTKTKNISKNNFQEKDNLRPKDLIKNINFWILWISYFLCLFIGLGTISNIVNYAVGNGISKLQAIWVLSSLAIVNGLIRPIMGRISDKIGHTMSLIIASIFSTIGFIILVLSNSLIGFIIGAVFIGIAFGTWLILYSPVSADFYGLKYLSSNFGLLFTSYGIGGIVGPSIFGLSKDLTNSYDFIFTTSIVISIITILLFSFIHRNYCNTKIL